MYIINFPFTNTNTFGIELVSNVKTEIKPEKFVFLIDISGSMGERIQNSRFSKKEYIRRIFIYLFGKLKREQLGTHETTISLVTFNDKPHPIFRDYKLTQILYKPEKFLNAITHHGGTRTDLVFDYVLDNFDSSYKFVLITDGECNVSDGTFRSKIVPNPGDVFFKNYLIKKLEELNTNNLNLPQFSIMIVGDGPLEASKYMVEKYNSILHYISSKKVAISGNDYFDEAQFEHIFKQELLKSISDNSDIKTDINICCSDPIHIYNSNVSINFISCEDELIQPSTVTNLGTSTFGTIRVFVNWSNPTPNSKFTISFNDSNGVEHSYHLFFSQAVSYDSSNPDHNKAATKFLTILMNKLRPNSNVEEIDTLIGIFKLYPNTVNSKFIIHLEEFKNMNIKERSLRLMSSRTEERARTPPRSVSPVSSREVTALNYDVDINGYEIDITNFRGRPQEEFYRPATPYTIDIRRT